MSEENKITEEFNNAIKTIEYLLRFDLDENTMDVMEIELKSLEVILAKKRIPQVPPFDMSLKSPACEEIDFENLSINDARIEKLLADDETEEEKRERYIDEFHLHNPRAKYLPGHEMQQLLDTWLKNYKETS
jgi:hypothetical protein